MTNEKNSVTPNEISDFDHSPEIHTSWNRKRKSVHLASDYSDDEGTKKGIDSKKDKPSSFKESDKTSSDKGKLFKSKLFQY